MKIFNVLAAQLNFFLSCLKAYRRALWNHFHLEVKRSHLSKTVSFINSKLPVKHDGLGGWGWGQRPASPPATSGLGSSFPPTSPPWMGWGGTCTWQQMAVPCQLLLGGREPLWLQGAGLARPAPLASPPGSGPSVLPGCHGSAPLCVCLCRVLWLPRQSEC